MRMLRRSADQRVSEIGRDGFLRETGRLVTRELPDGSKVDMVRKFFQPEIRKFDADTGEIEVVVSDGTIDRIGDTINPGGWELKNYRKNPVVLVDHRYSIYSIAGQAKKTFKADGRLVQLQALDPVDNEVAAKVRSLLTVRSLRTTSVGFIALEWEWRTEEDDDGRELIVGINFLKQELLEVSWVAVPANPNALVTGVGDPVPVVTPPPKQVETYEGIAREILAATMVERLEE